MSGVIERVLVLNVGKPSDGAIADRPEAYALRHVNPNYAVFVCSHKGEGQSGTTEFVQRYAELIRLPAAHYEVLPLDDPDDLVGVYERASALLQRLCRERPQARILVDYTAGTKSMSAGLAMAAIDQEDDRIELRLVRGVRGKFATVVPGTESFRPVSRVHDLRARRRLLAIRSALQDFDYAGAARSLDELIQSDVSSELASKLQQVCNLCRAFDAWDRWNLDLAERVLAQYRRLPTGAQPAYERLAVLDQLRIVRDAFAGKADLASAKDPYLAVEDLLFNAERRAAQGRYDDAVARVYRALELLAQLRLRVAHEIDTSAVESAKIPESIREELAATPRREGPPKVGLDWAWRLLENCPGDPLGRWFAERKTRVRDWLEHRNYSILAHGLRPIGEATWQMDGRAGIDLCREALGRLAEAKGRAPLRHTQFPQEELLAAVDEHPRIPSRLDALGVN